MKRLRCSIIRGGTSKGIFFLENDLPKDQKKKEKTILDIFGSPDVRQIDGLGGADILTSKGAIIGVSSRPDADVDYTFAQVMIDRAEIAWGINCGNISAAVGGFAVDESLVKAVEPVTKVRIYNTNTDKIIIASVPVINGKSNPIGDYRIDGVPGTGAKISLDFSQTIGSSTGKLLPTGSARDILNVEGLGKVTVSIVDIANLYLFTSAKDIGLDGTETVEDIIQNKEALEKAEMIRSAAALKLGLVKNVKEASTVSPIRPLSVFVLPSMEYLSHADGSTIKSNDIDLKAFITAMGQVHKAYAGTGAVCTGVAAKLKDSVVNEILSDTGQKSSNIRIGHPSGIMDIDVRLSEKDDTISVEEASFFRTARRIMDGYVYLKDDRS